MTFRLTKEGYTLAIHNEGTHRFTLMRIKILEEFSAKYVKMGTIFSALSNYNARYGVKIFVINRPGLQPS